MLSLLIAGAVAGAAMAADTWRPAHDGGVRGYVRPGSLRLDGAVGSPPPGGSPGLAADEAAFAESRSLSGASRWRQAEEDSHLDGERLLSGFDCALGVRATPRTTPALARLLGRLKVDAEGASEALKSRYRRIRPAAVHPDAPICIPRADWLATSPSYPSGHATIGWAMALVLTEAAPSRSDALLARGRDFGESRVICGVHYRSDVQAGQMLASALVARLHAEPAFTRDLASARREIAAAPRLAPEACAATGDPPPLESRTQR